MGGTRDKGRDATQEENQDAATMMLLFRAGRIVGRRMAFIVELLACWMSTVRHYHAEHGWGR